MTSLIELIFALFGAFCLGAIAVLVFLTNSKTDDFQMENAVELCREKLDATVIGRHK